jgi:hypothetical protein
MSVGEPSQATPAFNLAGTKTGPPMREGYEYDIRSPK